MGTGVWGVGVLGTCMGNEVQGYGAHRQWGTGAMGAQAKGPSLQWVQGIWVHGQ